MRLACGFAKLSMCFFLPLKGAACETDLVLFFGHWCATVNAFCWQVCEQDGCFVLGVLLLGSFAMLPFHFLLLICLAQDRVLLWQCVGGFCL
jgi:hypothetical protein